MQKLKRIEIIIRIIYFIIYMNYFIMKYEIFIQYNYI